MKTNKKVYTLTFQFANNYGAVIQTYALQEYLRLKCEKISVIDYWPMFGRNKFCLLGPLKKTFSLKNIVLLPFRVCTKHKFDTFKKKYINLTKRVYSKNELEVLDADITFVGSDQVWNPYILGEIDEVYFLNYCNAGIKASYAASIGQDDVDEGMLNKIAEYVNDFQYISVREERAIELLKKVGISNAVRVLDPVFLIDKKNYISWMKVPGVLKNKDYILTYYLDDNGITEDTALMMAERFGNIPVFSIGYSFKKKTKGIKAIGDVKVEEFVGAIANARMIVTSSFHGTALSIILNKDFYSVKAGNRSSRLISLLASLGLEDRYVTTNEELGYLKVESIDYEALKERINLEINKSKEFIDRVLNS